jgi:hypothetical protein
VASSPAALAVTAALRVACGPDSMSRAMPPDGLRASADRLPLGDNADRAVEAVRGHAYSRGALIGVAPVIQALGIPAATGGAAAGHVGAECPQVPSE